MEIPIKTKFNVHDIAYTFIEGEIHKVRVDRIEISIAIFALNENKNITTDAIKYFATIQDGTYDFQNTFKEKELYRQAELEKYMLDYMGISVDNTDSD